MGNDLRAQNRITSGIFLRILPVQVMLMAVSSVNAMIDGMIGSHLIGPEANAAIGMYTPMVFLLQGFCVIIMSGSQVLCGRHMGIGRKDLMNGVFSLNMSVTVIFGLVLTLLCLVSPALITSFLGASEETVGVVGGYVLGRAYGIVPLILSQQLPVFIQMEGENRFNYISMYVTAAVNVILDLLFVAGLGKGIYGLGLATSVSFWIYAAMQTAYMLIKQSVFIFSVNDLKWKELGPMLKLGFASGLVFLGAAVRGVILNHLLTTYTDTQSIEAFGAFIVIAPFVYALGNGTGSTCRMLTSISYGENDRASLRIIMSTVQKEGTYICLAEAVILFLLAGPIAGLYFPAGSAMYVMLKTGLRALAVWLIPFLNSNAMSAYYQAMGKTFMASLLCLLEGVIVVSAVAAILVPRIGISGIWAGFFLAEIACCLAIAVYPVIFWKRKPKTADEWLAIPGDFGTAEDRRLDLTLRSMEDVISCSEMIQDFCIGQGADTRHAHHAGLCMEEMAANIVKHGFGRDNKKHAIDVRITADEHSIKMSLRDNCVPFDPQEYYEMMNPEDKTKNIGMRLVTSLASEVSYQNKMGLNVLSATLGI